MSSFFDELKRRNVIKAAIAYAVIAWVVLQVFALILPNIQAPEWVMKMMTIFAIIGFPIWVLIAWVYEVTPDGLKKTTSVDKDKSITETTNKRLNILILIALVIAIAVNFINRPAVSATEVNEVEFFDKSIAVLPFDDMSSDGDTQWFCDGVTEDILTNLSRLKDLKVISRTSTERYKDTDKSIPEIANELGVSYLVEGSVRKYEDKVIITAQLIDAKDNHLWAENYNKNFTEVFKIQQDVSQKIVGQLKIAISPEEEEAINKLPTSNLDAYNLVLRGRSLYESGGQEKIDRGIELLTEATSLDPDYADAYAELAYANLLRMFTENLYYGDLTKRAGFLESAKKHNEVALLLEPNSVRANSTEGLIMTESDDEQTKLEAETYFKKALDLNPNDAVSNLEMAIFYNVVKNEPKKGLPFVEKAYELNPFSVDVIWSYTGILIDIDQATKARTLFDEKRSILPKEGADFFVSRIVDAQVIESIKNGNDRTQWLSIYETAISKEPNNASLYYALGAFHDTCLHDDFKSVEYMKLAMEKDDNNFRFFLGYQTMLCEAKLFDDAVEFRKSDIFKTASKREKLAVDFYLLYNQENYSEALKVLQDSDVIDRTESLAIANAQLGNKEKVLELFTNENTESMVTSKAFAYAILNMPDSMYTYLNNKNVNAKRVNSRREFDPYRTEERYIAFLEKNGLPVLKEINGRASLVYKEDQ
ncbi:MAG: hypothetical protein AAGH46_01465 [Bacteroidota bacterium]